jgi:hypothetical protein
MDPTIINYLEVSIGILIIPFLIMAMPLLLYPFFLFCNCLKYLYEFNRISQHKRSNIIMVFSLVLTIIVPLIIIMFIVL